MLLRVLGGLALEREGRSLTLGGLRAQRLLAALVAARGRIVSARELVEVVWRYDEPPRTSDRTLQAYGSRLRALLGRHALARERGGYRLDLDAGGIALDIDLFESALIDASKIDDTAAALAAFDQALTWWRGPPFGALADEPALAPEVTRLEELRAEAQTRRAELAVALGLPGALADLEALSLAEPQREWPTRRLAEELWRRGRTSEALRVLHRHRRALLEIAGLSPSAAVTSLERALLEGRAPGAIAPSTAPGRAAAPGRNPFKGLAAFTEADAAEFFGRERTVSAVAEAVVAHPLVAVIGPSGSGKSSLVLAGVVPRLRRGDPPFSRPGGVVVLRPGHRPLASLVAELAGSAVASRDTMRATAPIDSPSPEHAEPPLVVVDQFEESWTQMTDDAERGAWFDALVALVGVGGRVLLTVRADFVDRLLGERSLAPLVRRSAVLVPPLAPEELVLAVEGPLALVGASVEPALLARLDRDLANRPGSLPLLQYALTQLFDRSTGPVLGVDAYESIGGIESALANEAERHWHALDDDERSLVRRLFRRLVVLDDDRPAARRCVALTELPDVPRALVARFVDGRLLTANGSGDGATIEVAHEALLTGWARLRGWLDEDRALVAALRRLANTTAAWDEGGRDDADLLRGRHLDDALALLASAADDMSPRERSFVTVSAEARTREQQRQLVAESVELRQRDPRRAVATAWRAHELGPSADTVAAVQGALLACGAWLGDLTITGASDVVWTSNETVAVRADGAVVWYDVTPDADRERRRVLSPGVGPLAIDHARTRLAVAGGEDVTLLDARDGRALRRATLDDTVTSLAVAADGVVVVGSARGDVFLVDEHGTHLVGSAGGRVIEVDRSADGHHVAAATGLAGRCLRWDVRSAATPDELDVAEPLWGYRLALGVRYVGNDLLVLGGGIVWRHGEHDDERIGRAIDVPAGRWSERNMFWRMDVASLTSRLATAPGIGPLEVLLGGHEADTAERGALAPDGRTLATVGGGMVTLHALDGRTALSTAVPSHGSSQARLRADGRELAVSHHDGVGPGVHVWDLGGPAPRLRHVHADHNYAVYRRHQRELLLFSNERLTNHRWTGPGPADVEEIPSRPTTYVDIDITTDGRTFVQGSYDGTVDRYDVATGERLPPLEVDAYGGGVVDDRSVSLTFSTDGERAAVASWNGFVTVWDTTATTWQRLAGPAPLGVLAAFVGTSHDLVVADADELIRVDVTLQIVRARLALPDRLRWRLCHGDGLETTTDGRRAAVSLRGGLQVVDLDSFACVGQPFPHTGHVSPAIARDAALGVTVVRDHVHVWPLDPATWLTTARRLAR